MKQAECTTEIVRRFVEEVVTTGGVALLVDLVSPDCIEADGKMRAASWVVGMPEHIRAVRAIHPDLAVAIQHQMAEGEWIATASGTSVNSHSNNSPQCILPLG